MSEVFCYKLATALQGQKIKCEFLRNFFDAHIQNCEYCQGFLMALLDRKEKKI